MGDFIAAGGTVSVGVKNRATNEWIPVLPLQAKLNKLNSFSKKIFALEKAAVKSSEKVEALEKEQKELKGDLVKLGENMTVCLGPEPLRCCIEWMKLVILNVTDPSSPMDVDAVDAFAEQWWDLFHRQNPVLKHLPRHLVTLESILHVGSPFTTVGDFVAAGGSMSVGVKNKATDMWIPFQPLEALHTKLNSVTKKFETLETENAILKSQALKQIEKMSTLEDSLENNKEVLGRKLQALEQEIIKQKIEQEETTAKLVKVLEKHDRILQAFHEFKVLMAQIDDITV
ncbi:hypothetical protein HDU79_000317 [Rhizoclosmatium sp. JEL0117]|nr:hypothetical protein HDU79_000317 [Rhizoclosmatium sp. JEL0117]